MHRHLADEAAADLALGGEPPRVCSGRDLHGTLYWSPVLQSADHQTAVHRLAVLRVAVQNLLAGWESPDLGTRDRPALAGTL